MRQERLAALHEFLHRMVTAISTANLYALEHPQVDRICTQALTRLEDAFGTADELSLAIIEDQIVVAGKPLEGSLALSRLVELLHRRGIGHLKFVRGVLAGELLMLVGSMTRRGKGFQEVFSTEHIRLGTVEVRFSSGGGTEEGGSNESAALDGISEDDLACFLEVYEGVRQQRKLNIVGINDLVTGFIDGFKLAGFIDTFKQQTDPLLAVAPLRSWDEVTFVHSVNVCTLNLAQALSLGLEGPLLQEIGIAALLHDVGKLFLPAELLHKQQRLSPEEWQMVQEHPIRGAEFLLETPGVSRLSVITAFEHHLNYDLTGYPKVSAGWQASLCSQMTAISDCYDTLRHSKAGEGGAALEDISAYLLELAGTELHPALTRNFLEIMNRVAGSRTSGF